MIDKSGFIKNVAEVMLSDYSCVYYVDADTDEYCMCFVDPNTHELKYDQEGKDFFGYLRNEVSAKVFKEDKEAYEKEIQKDIILEKIRKGETLNLQFRFLVNGVEVYHDFRFIKDKNEDANTFVLGVINIDDYIRDKQDADRARHERTVYNQIADSLAGKFDVIYYINSESGKYLEFKANNIYGNLEIIENGQDFYLDAAANADIIVFSADREKVKKSLEKHYIISKLNDYRRYSMAYRLLVDDKIQHTRMTVMWASDEKHIIISVENITAEVKKEQEQKEALDEAKEQALRDGLTGVRNRTAYQEFEESLQLRIENDATTTFGIVIGDLNNLKLINDSLGHNAGDEYIRQFCKLLCDTFSHSPIFRIGGDEFAVVLRGRDYQAKNELIDGLRHRMLYNKETGSGPVAAIGMSVFDVTRDKQVSEVFDRADSEMFSNKRALKRGIVIEEKSEESAKEVVHEIPEIRKQRLDSLYYAFSVLAENGYAFICDVHYDFSRWSGELVKKFELPGRFMYKAGDIWAEHLHPDDRMTFKKSVDSIYNGTASEHDMYYRAQLPDGSYVKCLCRGLVVRNQLGEPEYFGGFIRLLGPDEG